MKSPSFILFTILSTLGLTFTVRAGGVQVLASQATSSIVKMPSHRLPHNSTHLKASNFTHKALNFTHHSHNSSIPSGTSSLNISSISSIPITSTSSSASPTGSVQANEAVITSLASGESLVTANGSTFVVTPSAALAVEVITVVNAQGQSVPSTSTHTKLFIVTAGTLQADNQSGNANHSNPLILSFTWLFLSLIGSLVYQLA